MYTIKIERLIKRDIEAFIHKIENKEVFTKEQQDNYNQFLSALLKELLENKYTIPQTYL